jgi:hypothetical protein
MSSMRTAHARILITALTVVAMAAATPTAMAQSVVDATAVEFGPSADHSAVSPEGTPLVTAYVLEILAVGSTVPAYAFDLGKPAPDADGTVRVVFAPLLTTPLVPEQRARPR